MKTCPKCGLKIENDNAKYCYECGEKLSSGVQTIKDGKLTLYTGDEETLTISNEVKEITRGAINNEKIRRIIIPSSVEKINAGGFQIARDNCSYTYFGCINNEEFIVDENNPNYKSIDGNLYNKDGTVLLQYAAGKKDEVFKVPEGVEEFKGAVFFGCLNLKKVILPSSFGSDEFLFFMPDQKIEIEISEENPNFKVIDNNVYSKDESVLVLYDKNKEESTFILRDSVKEIDNCAFIGANNLKRVIMSNNVTYIGESAFESCVELEQIVLSNNIKEIGTSAFSTCELLDNILLPSSLNEIPSFAFEMSGLSEVFIPSSIKRIGDFAFNYCEYITKLFIPSNVEEIGANAFSECYNLKEVILVEGLKIIKEGAFAETKIEEIKIPNSVKEIGDGVFDECNNLKVIYSNRDFINFPKGVEVRKYEK